MLAPSSTGSISASASGGNARASETAVSGRCRRASPDRLRARFATAALAALADRIANRDDGAGVRLPPVAAHIQAGGAPGLALRRSRPLAARRRSSPAAPAARPARRSRSLPRCPMGRPCLYLAPRRPQVTGRTARNGSGEWWRALPKTGRLATMNVRGRDGPPLLALSPGPLEAIPRRPGSS